MKARKILNLINEYTLGWIHNLKDHSKTTYESVSNPLTHISKLDTISSKSIPNFCGCYKIYKNLEIGLSTLFACLFLINSISFENESFNKE